MSEVGKVVLMAVGLAVFCAVGGYIFGADQARKAVLEEVRTGKSDAWKERCFQSDRMEEARQRAMGDSDEKRAAQVLAGVEVVVTPEIQKVLDKCVENGGTVDGVGGNGVICMMPY